MKEIYLSISVFYVFYSSLEWGGLYKIILMQKSIWNRTLFIKDA